MTLHFDDDTKSFDNEPIASPEFKPASPTFYGNLDESSKLSLENKTDIKSNKENDTNKVSTKTKSYDENIVLSAYDEYIITMLTDRIEKTCNFIKLNVVENYKNIYNIQIQNNNKTIDDLKFDIHFSFKKHIIEISEVQIMKGGNNNENNNDKFDVNNQIIDDIDVLNHLKNPLKHIMVVMIVVYKILIILFLKVKINQVEVVNHKKQMKVMIVIMIVIAIVKTQTKKKLLIHKYWIVNYKKKSIV